MGPLDMKTTPAFLKAATHILRTDETEAGAAAPAWFPSWHAAAPAQGRRLPPVSHLHRQFPLLLPPPGKTVPG